MNQQDLIDAVARTTGASKAEAAKAVAAVLDALRASLQRGEKVAIAGFGSFETAQRGRWMGRNLHTGQALEIPAGAAIKFRPAQRLKDAVNGGQQG
jgi:DNA-binding protein HU-beta